MGPCSQKILENNGNCIKGICSLGSIDTKLSDYLFIDFFVKSMVKECNGFDD